MREPQNGVSTTVRPPPGPGSFRRLSLASFSGLTPIRLPGRRTAGIFLFFFLNSPGDVEM